ncbi:MAG: radical SAM protein [Spirochaetales bacterium]|nr:MAG: radical SAM protein [Spirochaetales bacterium]
MYDSFNRGISYLRVSVTDKCNLRCTYCMPEEGIPKRGHSDMMTFESLTEIVKAAVGLGITKVRLTGGEPLVKKGIVELTAMLRSVEGLNLLCMTTNGTLLKAFARDLRRAGLDSINVSLDTMDAGRYSRLTRGGLIDDVLEGIFAAKAEGFPVKINTVVLPDTHPDELERVKAFCSGNNLAHQLIRGFSLTEEKLTNVDYHRPGACGDCNRIRLLSDGILKPCLHSDVEIPVDMTNPRESLIQAVLAKPLSGSVCQARTMMEIGG